MVEMVDDLCNIMVLKVFDCFKTLKMWRGCRKISSYDKICFYLLYNSTNA